MDPFDALSDPVRRRILESLIDGERSDEAIASLVQQEFGILESSVEWHLRVLVGCELVMARVADARRYYGVNSARLREMLTWPDDAARVWRQRLDALETELARGKRQRRDRG